MNYQQTYNPFAQNEAIIKNYFKRKSVLTMAVLYCISILVTIGTIIVMGFVYPDVFSTMSAELGLSAQELQEAGASLFSSSLATSIFSIIAALPSIVVTGLTAAAYFILYLKSKDENPTSTPKAGITILFVLAIIALIAASFYSLYILLAILILGILAIIGISNPSALDLPAQDAALFTTAILIALVIFALLLAFVLTYSISRLIYISSIRKSINGPVLYNKGAGTYSVCSIVLLVFASIIIIPLIIFSFLMPMIFEAAGIVDPHISSYLNSMTPMYIMSAFAMIVSAAMFITDIVIARGYKKYINEIVSEYTNPLYADQLSAIPAMQVVCPRCGSAVSAGESFCGTCGCTLNITE